MTRKWHSAALALLLGFLSWYMVSFEQKVESNIEVRLEFSGQPTDLVIRRGLADKVTVRVRGPRTLVRALDGRRLGYPVDLAGIKSGENVIGLTSGRVPIKAPLEVVELTPQKLMLVAEEVAEKSVPVKAVWAGQLEGDWLLKESELDPPTVTLRGPKSVVNRIDQAQTLDIAIRDKQPTVYEGMVGLNLPEDVEPRPALVRVMLVFGPRTSDAWLTAPVAVNNAGKQPLSFGPKEVELRLRAPVKLWPKLKDLVGVSLAIPGNLPPGKHSLPFQLKLPEYVTLLEARPAVVVVDIPASPGVVRALDILQ